MSAQAQVTPWARQCPAWAAVSAELGRAPQAEPRVDRLRWLGRGEKEGLQAKIEEKEEIFNFFSEAIFI
jgi:hypothetical protein